MFVERLALCDFRPWRREQLSFENGLNVISGANGLGKTAVLEAIYFLVTGRSFRTQRLRELIRHTSPSLSVEAHFTRQGVGQRLFVSADGTNRHIIHNETPIRSVQSLLGLLPGVVMTPDDSVLIKGAPETRRRFVDLHVAQTDPLYVHHLTRYHRALRQRNLLLRAGDVGTIDAWEQQMAASAGYITNKRREAIDRLSSLAQRHYADIGDRSSLTLQYRLGTVGTVSFGHETLLDTSFYLERYRRHRRKELQVGCSLIGPHRDEMIVMLDERAARTFASEGQQRCCVAALRLAEWQCLYDHFSEKPIMMIDDFGISLDADRRQCLLEKTKGLGQVILTVTDTARLSLVGAEQANVITLAQPLIVDSMLPARLGHNQGFKKPYAPSALLPKGVI